MSEEASAVPAPGVDDAALRGAVIAGVVPGQSSRVVREAGRYAALLGVHLLVVHVDVTRFVTYEDPDGYVHSAPLDAEGGVGSAELAAVTELARTALDGRAVEWSVRQLIGDPALAIKHLAEKVDARLIVVGTRRRGLGESIREFFTGAVAARLAHRQQRPVLVVPLGDPVADDQDIWPDAV